VTAQPFHLELTEDDIVAAMERDDYLWLVDNVFTRALAQFIREQHTAALVKGSALSRSRRSAGPRRYTNHRTRRSHEFRP
jgi:hypothetical protein